MISFYNKDSIKVGTIIKRDGDDKKYKVISCINLAFFGKEMFQVNVKEV